MKAIKYLENRLVKIRETIDAQDPSYKQHIDARFQGEIIAINALLNAEDDVLEKQQKLDAAQEQYDAAKQCVHDAETHVRTVTNMLELAKKDHAEAIKYERNAYLVEVGLSNTVINYDGPDSKTIENRVAALAIAHTSAAAAFSKAAEQMHDAENVVAASQKWLLMASVQTEKLKGLEVLLPFVDALAEFDKARKAAGLRIPLSNFANISEITQRYIVGEFTF